MSNSPEFDLNLDQLFLPAWAQKPSTEKSYEKFKGREGDHSGGTGNRDRNRGDRKPNRFSGSGRGERPSGGGSRPAGAGGRPPRGRNDRQGGSRDGRDNRDSREGRDNRGGFRDRPERRQQLPDFKVGIVPVEDGVRSLARQIKKTCRAYPLFEIAAMILKRPERFDVRFDVAQDEKGVVKAPLYVCSLDGSVWLSESEVTEHVLKNFFDNFYQTEKTPSNPPKGVYTFVAQCGMSGIILGPPNYHDYQRTLHQVHSEKFPRMDFETFKSRVKIVRDEDVVKQWIDERSWKTDYVCLNVPEPLTLDSREAVEAHFKSNHLPNLISSVQHVTVHANEEDHLGSASLKAWLRRVREEQRRFPIRVVNALSQQFARQGLQFFKVNKTVTHVSVARPRYLDVNVTPVSDLVKRIVDYIENHKNCTPAQLVSDLTPEVEAKLAGSAPTPAPAPAVVTAPAESASTTETEEPAAVAVADEAPSSMDAEAAQPISADAPVEESAPVATEEASAESTVSEPAPTESEAPQASEEPKSASESTEAPAETSSDESHKVSDSGEDHTPAQAAILGDLRWLLVQGHVIEFANGALENAKPSAALPVKAKRDRDRGPKKSGSKNKGNSAPKEKSNHPASAETTAEQSATSETIESPVAASDESQVVTEVAQTESAPVEAAAAAAAVEPEPAQQEPVSDQSSANEQAAEAPVNNDSDGEQK